MLSDAQSAIIAGLLKIPVEEFTAALKDTEVKEVKLVEGLHVFDETELTTLKSNEYKAGKEKGVEMAVKEVKEKEGLNFTGKTVEGLVQAVKQKAVDESNANPDQRVKDLSDSLKTAQDSYSKLEKDSAKLTERVAEAEAERDLYRTIPTLGEGALGIDKVATLMKSDGYSFSIVDGSLVPHLKGEVVKDKLGNPVPVKDVVTTYATQNNLLKIGGAPAAPGGRGGGDNGGKLVFTKQSELKAHFQESGKNIQGKDYMDAIREARKANPDFDMNA